MFKVALIGQDFNQISFHFLKCVYAHLLNTNGQKSLSKKVSKQNKEASLKSKIMEIIGAPKWANDPDGCCVDVIFEKLKNEDMNAIRFCIYRDVSYSIKHINLIDRLWKSYMMKDIFIRPLTRNIGRFVRAHSK